MAVKNYSLTFKPFTYTILLSGTYSFLNLVFRVPGLVALGGSIHTAFILTSKQHTSDLLLIHCSSSSQTEIALLPTK